MADLDARSWRKEIDDWFRANQRWLTTGGPSFGEVIDRAIRWGISLGLERAACLQDRELNEVADAMARRLRDEKPYPEAR